MNYNDLETISILDYFDYPLSELLKDPINNQLYLSVITGETLRVVKYLVLPTTFHELRNYIKKGMVLKDIFIRKTVFITDENMDFQELHISQEKAEELFTGKAELYWLIAYSEEEETKEIALKCLDEMEKKFNGMEYDESCVWESC